MASLTLKASQFSSQKISKLVVLNGDLFAATSRSGIFDEAAGLLLKWNGSDSWTQVAPSLGTILGTTIPVVFNGKIYVGTMNYTDGGKLFEWNGVDAWTEKAGQIEGQDSITSLCVYSGELYATTNHESDGGRLFKWNGVDAWTQVVGQFGSEESLYGLIVFNSKLYAVSATHGLLLEFDGVSAWTQKAPQLGSEWLYSYTAVHNNELFAGSATSGKLVKWNGTNAWVEVAPRYKTADQIVQMLSLDGYLYAGCGSVVGEIIRWNGANAWEAVADRYETETPISLCVLNSQLYIGTSGLALLLVFVNSVSGTCEGTVPAPTGSGAASTPTLSGTPNSSLFVKISETRLVALGKRRRDCDTQVHLLISDFMCRRPNGNSLYDDILIDRGEG